MDKTLGDAAHKTLGNADHEVRAVRAQRGTHCGHECREARGHEAPGRTYWKIIIFRQNRRRKSKKKVCARRESDPGPKLGKLRCCHYTTSAGSVFKKRKIYKPISSMYRALVSSPCVRAVWNGLVAGLHHSCSFILLPGVMLCAYESFQIHLLHI